MPSPFTSIGPYTFQTYALLTGAGIVLSIVAAGLIYRRTSSQAGAAVDACLAGLAGGLIGARLLHVALNWIYFQEHTSEIARFDAGGLNWHGAVIGGLVGALLYVRVRRLAGRALLDGLTFALPLLTFFAWWGCGAARCAFGAEVANLADYPDLLVWEAPDIAAIRAPRFAVQTLGMMLGAGLFIIAGLVHWRGWLIGRRFWVVLALLAAGMFALGFLRGDYAPVLAGLRGDQWLDLAFIVGAALIFSAESRRSRMLKNRNEP